MKTVENYDNMAEEYAKRIEKAAPLVEIRKFLKLLPKKAKILDLACAAGRDSRIFKSKGTTPIGVDLSAKLLAIARKKNPKIKFVLADVRKLPFGQKVFDGVWAGGILHHFSKKGMLLVLREANRVLKKNGVLCVTTKMGRGVWKGTDALSPKTRRELILLSVEEVEELMQKAGFAVASIYSWNEKNRRKNGRNLEWVSAFAIKE